MIVLIFLLGIIVGSFLNVCIYRLPKKEGIVFPDSYCPMCGTPLKWYNLIPIISFIVQKGRCGYCGGNISPQYPIVEFLNGILYIVLYSKFRLHVNFLFYGTIFSILIVVSVIDLYHQIIPDILNISILVAGTIYGIILSIQLGALFNIIASLLGLIISGSTFLLIAIISKGNMGGGDIKLIAVLGFILGWRKALLNMFLSFVFGAVISIFLLLFRVRGRRDAIPFGPFICLAFVITLLWGDEILGWYMGIF
ncbi:MAG TPA: prepilin peptidase [Tepidimicrobium sp.]|nr:prepilin peptidase [Tepidimicrobium sp.]